MLTGQDFLEEAADPLALSLGHSDVHNRPIIFIKLGDVSMLLADGKHLSDPVLP